MNRVIDELIVLFLLPVTLFMQTPLICSQSPTDGTDALALLSFKAAATKGDALDVWNSSIHHCLWFGVTCGDRRRPTRVTGLRLESLELGGTISPSLSNLTHLAGLHLFRNSLHGSIPQELGRLQLLRNLRLASNSLEGQIPADLSNCSVLESLSLGENNLSGGVPSELGMLHQLRRLNLSYNGFTGTIPTSFGNLSSLTDLLLSSNRLEGRLPANLDRIFGLKILYVSGNQLSGEIPPSLSNFSSLTYFSVRQNLLSGALPPDFGRNLPNLSILDMAFNDFQGALPSSIANATKLEFIQLIGNRFGGSVPPTIGSLTSLSIFDLDGNMFEASEPDGWTFVTSLSSCTQLEELDLSRNHFGGSLPDSIANLSKQMTLFRARENMMAGRIPLGIGELSSLTLLDLALNSLSGSIPDSLAKLRDLGILVLNGNKFSGEIPSSIGNLTRMSELFLQDNNFEGPIPNSFAAFTSLREVDLSYNNLTGTVPRGVLRISSLSTYLNLSHNSLTGPLHEEVGSLVNLVDIDVSHNNCSGKIPASLGKCVLLNSLKLQGNNFEGPIPNLGGLRGIEMIDLSQNHLSGPIPEFLVELPFLQYLNLSFNNLTGEVPTNGVFRNLTLSSIQGNQELCGGGNHTLTLSPCSKGKKMNKLSAKVIAIIVVSIVLCSFFLFCLLLRFFSKKKSRLSPSRSLSEGRFLKTSYRELFEATDGFAPSTIIGSGGFGVVYRGFLERANINIAVKVFNQQLLAAAKSFTAECKVMRNVRHRNLLRIVTSCSSSDMNGNDFKALVCEFIPNGDLERWLHANERAGCLSFLRRLNIAIHVASALDYLHTQIKEPIVHCDLKPSNILIDYDMTAYVSDFGVARILTSCTETSTVGFNGTVGYIAPECGLGSPASTTWDVYSYGILLLEMFTGKRPTNESFQDGLSLRRYVEASFPDKVVNIADPRMLPQEDIEMEDRIRISLASILRIALVCTKESSRERMRMQDAVRDLEAIKSVFLGGERHGIVQ